jgi:predicted O-linked N-acetylglucosamine transferase (SPINDLY family)
LPDKGFVYCSFNASDKIDAPTFDLWMGIVRRVPGSVLWQRESNAEVRDNLRREAAKRGVDAGRLVFADAEPDMRVHLARHGNADLFIDTFNHGAHGTAVDALWAGLPLLTCPGETFASRVAASTLSAVGLTELIAETPEHFAELAVGVAGRPEELAGLREKLDRNRRTHALFDTARLAKHLGCAFNEMWRRYEAGEPPREIAIAPGP